MWFSNDSIRSRAKSSRHFLSFPLYISLAGVFCFVAPVPIHRVDLVNKLLRAELTEKVIMVDLKIIRGAISFARDDFNWGHWTALYGTRVSLLIVDKNIRKTLVSLANISYDLRTSKLTIWTPDYPDHSDQVIQIFRVDLVELFDWKVWIIWLLFKLFQLFESFDTGYSNYLIEKFELFDFHSNCSSYLNNSRHSNHTLVDLVKFLYWKSLNYLTFIQVIQIIQIVLIKLFD